MAPASVVARSLAAIFLGSCRVASISGEERLSELTDSGRPAVFTSWHNRANFCGYFLSRRWRASGHKLGIMTSTSRDGEIASRVARRLGMRVARGSVGQGGVAGLKAMHRLVAREGVSVFSVADGSRGPIYEAQAGVVVLAQTAKAPLVPMSFAAEKCWRATSWDRLIIPQPFSRVAVAVGDPLRYSQRMSSDELEQAQSDLGETLHELARAAEKALAR